MIEMRPEVELLENVEDLDLRANQWEALLPEIVQLGRLVFLDLANNRLTLIPSEIAQMESLGLSDFTDNSIEVVPPDIYEIDGFNIWLDLCGGCSHNGVLNRIRADVRMFLKKEKR